MNHAGNGNLTFHQPVADAAHGVEILGGAAHLFAEPAHVGIDGAGVDEVVVFPDILEKFFARLHAAPALREDGEEFEFGGGELDRKSVV